VSTQEFISRAAYKS